MTRWHEYQCEDCGRLFVVKDCTLSGRVVCHLCSAIVAVGKDGA